MLRMKKRPKDQVLAEIRERVTLRPDMNVTIGQPISHRIDHMLSGTRANIAVKVFGDDLTMLRSLARQVEAAMGGIDGVVDLSMEQQTDIPTVRVRVRPEDAARYGLQPGEVAATIQTAFVGIEVNRVLEGQLSFPMVVRYAEMKLDDLDVIGRTLIDSPSGAKVPDDAVADIREDRGPQLHQRRECPAQDCGAVQCRRPRSARRSERDSSSSRREGKDAARLPRRVWRSVRKREAAASSRGVAHHHRAGIAEGKRAAYEPQTQCHHSEIRPEPRCAHLDDHLRVVIDAAHFLVLHLDAAVAVMLFEPHAAFRAGTRCILLNFRVHRADVRGVQSLVFGSHGIDSCSGASREFVLSIRPRPDGICAMSLLGYALMAFPDARW